MKKSVLFKKYVSGVFALSLFTVTVVQAKSESLIVIDSISLMQQSQEGKKLAEVMKKKITDFQNYVKKNQDELTSLQQEVGSKADVLSKEALQEKMEQLSKKKKEAERAITDKEEALRIDVQRDQIKLREKQLNVVSKLFEQEGWGLMVDKNTPGVLFVAKGIDKTEEALKVVDASYEASLKMKSDTKQLAKGNEASKASSVKTIKQA